MIHYSEDKRMLEYGLMKAEFNLQMQQNSD